MARRRMIDPNIWQSEDVSKLTLRQRLLLIGLFSNADDEGKLRGNPAFVRSLVFPYEDFTVKEIESDLQAVESIGSIVLYEVDDSKYIKLMNWKKFQRVDKPQKSMIPEPPEKQSKNDSKNDSETDSRLKERKGKEEEEKGKEGEEEAPKRPSLSLVDNTGSEKIKDHLHALVNTCEIKDYTLYDLDIIYSYLGLVDVEVIEAAIKKGQGKHVNYVKKTLKGMYEEGTTKKEQLFEKPAQTGRNQNTKKDTLPDWIAKQEEEAKQQQQQSEAKEQNETDEAWRQRIQSKLKAFKPASNQ